MAGTCSEEAHPLLEVEGGTLSVDDTVLDKPYSQEGKTELVGYFWSGKHGRAVKGVCLVTLLYSDPNGVCLPVDFRLVDKAEGKTKNERFRAMVDEALGWGLRPAVVSALKRWSCLQVAKSFICVSLAL